MARTTHETLLISSIINSGDVHMAAGFGVRPEHFDGYRGEYQWVLNYYTQYASCPSLVELQTAFPNFPHDPDQTDGRWSAYETKRLHNKKEIRDRITQASIHLQKDNVEDAAAALEGYKLDVAVSRPTSALLDHKFLDDYFDTQEPRIPLPYPTLQAKTNGIGPGELWYFAARQGHGKSSYLIDIACEAVLAGQNVVVYSLEMTKRQTQVRMHAALGRRLGLPVDANAMLRRSFDPVGYKRLLGAIEEQVPGTLAIHEVSMGRVTPAVIDSNAGDFNLSIVDYVGLMRADDGTPAIKDYRVIGEISNTLKSIALSRHTGIIAASQINRDGVSTSWRPPAIHTLAQSDHLGNDGDVVITMKRYGLGASVHSLEKNRHGQSGICYFTKYDANHGDFTEITRDEADEIRMNEEDAQ